MKRYVFAIICTLAVVLWVAFIFANSAQTGEESGATSSDVQELINEILHNIGIDVTLSEHTVRKCAHFGEYMLLGLLACADIFVLSSFIAKRSFKLQLLSFLGAIPFSGAVALIDEFVVQMSTEGRGPSLTDVLIDLGGSGCGVLLVFCVVFIIVGIKRIKTKNSCG